MRTVYFVLMLITLGTFLRGVMHEFDNHAIAIAPRSAGVPAAHELGPVGTTPAQRALANVEANSRENRPTRELAIVHSTDSSALVHSAALQRGYGAPNEAAWTVHTSISPIDDSTNVLLQILSNDVVPSKFGGPIRLALAMRCSEGKPSLSVDFGDHFMVSSKFADWGAVSYRIDRAPAAREEWTHTTDNASLMVADVHAIRVMRQLLGAKTLLVQATPFGEGPITATFDVDGLEAVIAPLRSACHW